MADYNLARLSARDFEHLVQALALEVIGRGVTVFGDGADGGREATFDGRCPFPSKTENWDGYLVIQCKAKLRPTGDTTVDGQWAVAQFKAELETWSSKPERKRPEYFIAVTNVVLSPVEAAGTKDKLTELLASYKPLLGFRDFRVWDHDQLCRLLDTQDSVRRVYAPFVQLGDVLSDLAPLLASLRKPDFARTMSIFLQGELIANSPSRLEQAGHPGTRVEISRVFTDIHVTPIGTSEVRVVPSTGCASHICKIASSPNRTSGANNEAASTLTEQVTAPAQAEPQRGRFVLVGGPGQGKSTLAQYICQLYRAALLKDRADLDPVAQAALKTFLTETPIPIPEGRRFPYYVDLANLASSLASGKVRTLGEYLADSLSRTDQKVESLTVMEWISDYPWLLMLDGLDEVPAAQDRDRTLNAINNFLIAAHEAKSDGVVVATTRPQGYSQEFTTQVYTHLQLNNLTIEQALEYARKLCHSRHSEDRRRAESVYKRLEQAATEKSAVSLLLRTPLHTAMLAALVDTKGAPPEQRWRLFSRYYQYTYDREAEKEGSGALLRERESDIEAIHRACGLHIHRAGELAGGTDASVATDTFTRIVDRRLDSEGVSGRERRQLSTELAKVALNRLVLLVAPRPERIGFELRQIQEYMAAEALLAADDETVRRRLTAAAQSSHWRQPLLFACARCFADTSLQRFRAFIIELCHSLNSESERDRGIGLAGSRLALDLLEEHISQGSPIYHRSLLELALQLANVAPNDIHRRVARTYTAEFRDTFESTLRMHTGLGVWAILLRLLEEADSLISLADALWESEGNRAGALLAADGLTSSWYVSRLIDALPSLPPWQLAEQVQLSPRLRQLIPAWAVGAIELSERHASLPDLSTDIRLSNDSVLTVKHDRPDSDHNQALQEVQGIPSGHPAWLPLVAGARFASAPSAETLAQSLTELHGRWDGARDGFLLDKSNWPFDACVRSGVSLATLILRLREDRMGDTSSWAKAALRLKSQEISHAEISATTESSWPFDENIERFGIPAAALRPSFAKLSIGELQHVFDGLIQLRGGVTAPSLRRHISNWLIDLLTHAGMNNRAIAKGPSPQLFEECLADKLMPLIHVPLLRGFSIEPLQREEWIRVLDALGRSEVHFNYYYWSQKKGASACAASLLEWYIADQRRLGILNLLHLLALEGEPIRLSPNYLKSPGAVPRFREAAIALELIQPECDERRAMNLGEEAASLLESDAHILDNYGDLLKGQRTRLSIGAAFFSALRSGLPAAQRSRVGATIQRWAQKAYDADPPAVLSGAVFQLDPLNDV